MQIARGRTVPIMANRGAIRKRTVATADPDHRSRQRFSDTRQHTNDSVAALVELQKEHVG